MREGQESGKQAGEAENKKKKGELEGSGGLVSDFQNNPICFFFCVTTDSQSEL